MSENPLRTTINLLRDQDQKWRKSGKKRALYAYLETVFIHFAASQHDGVAKQRAKKFAKLAGMHRGLNQHPIRILIDATSTADRKCKSRWTRALRYAWCKRKNYKDLKHCLRENRGVAGCAEEWALLRAATQTPAGYVRVGGENRVPKIPFFVAIESLDAYGNWR